MNEIIGSERVGGRGGGISEAEIKLWKSIEA